MIDGTSTGGGISDRRASANASDSGDMSEVGSVDASPIQASPVKASPVQASSVKVEIDGAVMVVTIDRPQVRNAVDRPTADRPTAGPRVIARHFSPPPNDG